MSDHDGKNVVRKQLAQTYPYGGYPYQTSPYLNAPQQNQLSDDVQVYSENGPYGPSIGIAVVLKEFSAKFDVGAYTLDLDKAGNDNKFRWGNNISLSASGSPASVFLVKDFFTLTTDLGVDFHTVSYGDLGGWYQAKVGVSLYFYPIGGEDRDNHIVRFGLKPLSFDFGNRVVKPDSKLGTDSWFASEFAPVASMLYYHKSSGFGFLLQGRPVIGMTGKYSYDELVTREVGGKKVTETVNHEESAQNVGGVVSAEVFWNPLTLVSDSPSVNGFGIYLGYEHDWNKWNQDETTTNPFTNTNVDYNKISFGLRWNYVSDPTLIDPHY